MARPHTPEPTSPVFNIPPKAVFLYGLGTLCLHFWLTQLCNNVPEPYLDEVFHIPQAQAYWAGLWRTWDPKITTPPGLYMYSYLFAKLCAVFGERDLSVRQLRISVEALLLLMPLVLLRCHPRYHNYKRLSPTQSIQIMHSSLNIMLCPLLFFFSALYYTDVLSAMAVTEVYRWYVYSAGEQGHDNYLLSMLPSVARSAICRMAIFLLGLFAMLCRQTNVFWVAIFMGGLQAVRTVTASVRPDSSIVNHDPPASVNANMVFDPPVQDAAIEDWVLTASSLILVAPMHITQMIVDLLPYLGMFVAFTGFVIWNGGVVLGDKDNHIASIHFPQILYIWPCIFFFSWPMMLPNIAKLSRNQLPRPLVALTVMGLMLLAVHFNTIVHPFTLADNRHYVFYVFRILLRYPGIKYAAVPVYFTCAWLVINALGGMPEGEGTEVSPNKKQERKENNTESILSTPKDTTRVSFVLVWLFATTLSLVTAPLVEPRYFIVPWLVWRMNIPVDSRRTDVDKTSSSSAIGLMHHMLSFTASNRLWIETAWYLLINFVTCYAFLYRGFEWPQEPGMVQRFMW